MLSEGHLMVESCGVATERIAYDPLFQLSISFSSGAVVVGVRGELDLETASGLRALSVLADAGTPRSCSTW